MNIKSVGKTLQAKRFELQWSIAECAEKTKITKRFIQALEDDNFDVFPGEAYYLGFLRTYSLLLSLESDEMVKMYFKQKKIDQPAPLAELTKPLIKKFSLKLKITKNMIIIAASSLAFLVIVLMIFIIQANLKNNVKSSSGNTSKSEQVTGYIFEERRVVKAFKLNELINIPLKTGYLTLKIDEIDSASKAVKLDVLALSKQFLIAENETLEIDFNKDTVVDMSIYVNSVGEVVTFTFERLTTDMAEVMIDLNQIKHIAAQSETREIVMLVTCKNRGYVKVYTDTEQPVEKFLEVNESLRINAKEDMEIHMTNAQNMIVKINNKDITLPQKFILFIKIKWNFDSVTQSYSLITEFKE